MRNFYTEAEMDAEIAKVVATRQAIFETKIPPIFVEKNNKFIDQLVAHMELYKTTSKKMVLFITAEDYRDFVLNAKFNGHADFKPTPIAKLRDAGYLGQLNGYAVYTSEGLAKTETMPAKSGIFF